MACARRRAAVALGARVLVERGRPIPRQALDVLRGVQCAQCGFRGAGVVFRWDEARRQGFCPKCRSYELRVP